MTRPILVINCGSSSIKFALVPETGIDNPAHTRRSGLAENLGSSDAVLTVIDENGNKHKIAIAHADHTQALTEILRHLGDTAPIAIGHRVVHGGEAFTRAVQINADVLAAIKATTPLAPLHNPANLLGIDATLKLFADLPQVAVFDTAFHQTMPAHAFRYALPEELYSEHGIRRYGFHGTSHRYVSQHADQITGISGGWLSAHLGNGCSTCAIWQGQSLDTSMGLTPLEGVVMGTRSGNVDPSLHVHLVRTLGWTMDQIDQILNKKSGLLGLSSLSNDMRTLLEARDGGHLGAKLAIDVFCYRLAQSLAAMSCALPVFNGILFTGGIGENAAAIRAQTIAQLPHFGLGIDPEQNQLMIRGKEGRIDVSRSDPDARQIWVIPTDEEGQIASETRGVLGL